MPLKNFAIFPILLFAFPAYSQNLGLYDPLSAIRQYFQLTDTQAKTILATNDAYNEYSQQKQNRIRTVQEEIASETAKDSLDGFQIGIRYAEVEAICRDLRTRAAAVRQKNVDVLTPAQTAKLTALEDAMKLAAVISGAQQANLAGAITGTPGYFLGSPLNPDPGGVPWLSIGYLGGFYFSGTVSGCGY